MWNFNSYILTEVTDRCNLECPHCYHLPDNKIKDVALASILERVKQYHPDIYHVILAGAESSLRRDINELVSEIYKLGRLPQILTNGVRFADENFVKGLVATNAGMTVTFGLNHPSYLNNETIRNKQIRGILNVRDQLDAVSYVGYTMVALDELDYILTEITTTDWCNHSRIRSGSEIGRNATDGPIFVSDVAKSQCAEIANTDLSQIENPRLTDRQPWVERLSMFHWNFDELKSGECWTHMRKFIQ
jgi:hypothetical protein